MKFINIIGLTTIGFSSVHSQLSSSEGPCQLESVFNECVERGKLFLSYCPSGDVTCLCRKNQDILICFQRCYSSDKRYSEFKNNADSHCANVPAANKNQTLNIPPIVGATNTSETTKPTSLPNSSDSSSGSTVLISNSRSKNSSSTSGATDCKNAYTPISFVAFLAYIFL